MTTITICYCDKQNKICKFESDMKVDNMVFWCTEDHIDTIRYRSMLSCVLLSVSAFLHCEDSFHRDMSTCAYIFI